MCIMRPDFEPSAKRPDYITRYCHRTANTLVSPINRRLLLSQYDIYVVFLFCSVAEAEPVPVPVPEPVPVSVSELEPVPVPEPKQRKGLCQLSLT